jgi:hypothetical protein
MFSIIQCQLYEIFNFIDRHNFAENEAIFSFCLKKNIKHIRINRFVFLVA